MFANIADEILKQAIKQEIEERMEKIPDEYPPYVFSKRYERRMRRIINDIGHTPLTQALVTGTKRVAAVLVVSFLVTAAVTFGVDGFRERFIAFISEQFQKYSQISTKRVWSELEEFRRYEPTYIPEGFDLVHTDYEHMVLMVYEDKQGNIISFDQRSIILGKIERINTEETKAEEIKINGNTGFFYTRMGRQNLDWYDENYWYSITSTLSREELTKIAESVELK